MNNTHLSPFGLSLSKPSFFLRQEVKSFDKLTANGRLYKESRA